MDELIQIIHRLMELALGNDGVLDENAVNELLKEGYEENSVERALTLLQNIFLHKQFLNRKFSGHHLSIRHFVREEEMSLGDEVCENLYFLQFAGLLNPSEVDFLVSGYMGAGGGRFMENDDFFGFLKAFRSDSWEYLNLTRRLKSSKSFVLH